MTTVRRVYLDEDELSSLGLAAQYLTMLRQAVNGDDEEWLVTRNEIDPKDLRRVEQEIERLYRHASAAVIAIGVGR